MKTENGKGYKDAHCEFAASEDWFVTRACRGRCYGKAKVVRTVGIENYIPGSDSWSAITALLL